MSLRKKVVALAGGVGGARLAQGLYQLSPEALTVVVNTGDDFDHLGLRICPDIDTVLYTLAGLEDPDRGWGLRHESWAFLDQLKKLGLPTWFQLGDRDLATHLFRTERLQAGANLTTIVSELAGRLGIAATILPVSDEAVRTIVQARQGELSFQDYFVRLRCAPEVSGFRFAGSERAQATGGVVAALQDPGLAAVVICPSNPFVSIDPILSVDGLRARIQALRVPVIAVSPIIGGRAVKGPAGKMMAELGLDVSALGIARYYQGLLTGLVIDEADAALKPSIERLDIAVAVADTLMSDQAGRRRVAQASLDLAQRVKSP